MVGKYPEAQTTQTNNSTLVQGTQSDTGRPIPDQDITVIKPDRDISPTILESPTQSNSPNDKIDKLSIIVILITAFIVTLICNYATIWRDTQKSIDERFLKSIELIGHERIAVRSGAIISLKQVFQDSPNKQKESIELLANLVRINSPVSKKTNSNRPVPSDVAMALKVIKQTERKLKDTEPKVKDEEAINLSHVYLYGVDLYEGKLENISFNYSNLKNADLVKAELKGSYFILASLEGANLKEAKLQGSYLEGANLENTNLEGSHLEGATFDLEESHPEGTKFDKKSIMQIKKACNWDLAHYESALEKKIEITKAKRDKKVLDKSKKCKHFIPKQSK